MAIVVSSPNKVTGADPNPTSPYRAGVRYRLLDTQHTQVKPGMGYAYYRYNQLWPAAREIAIDYYSNAAIEAGTVVTCLEARKNRIRTEAGWILGTTGERPLITEA